MTMNNIRLSTTVREQIRRALLSTRFDKRTKELEAAQDKLARDVYETAYDQTTRRKMNALPEGWLPETKSVWARFGCIDFHRELPDKKRLRVPFEKHGHYGSSAALLAVDADHVLSKRHQDIRKELDAIQRERNDLTREIDAVLFSVTTANKLVDVWPEIRKTVEDICKTYVASSNLPAPRVEFLNKTLGLTKAA
jgi:hypothetical protein